MSDTSTPHPDAPSRGQDAAVGGFYLAAGSFFAAFARDHELGSAADMGPGYLPFWLGLILALIGVAILARSWTWPDWRALQAATRTTRRVPPLAVVLAAIVFFGLAVESAGLLVTTAVMTLIASTASHEFRWRRALLCSAIIAAFCSVLFVVLLKLQLPVWPAWGA